MTTASSETVAYWGIGGEYGPFPIQEDGEWAGWPDFGKVLHYFIKKANLNLEQFGELYGQRINPNRKTPLTRRQVEHMIYDRDKFPEAINRRRVIAELLNIPPALLGIATLEIVSIQPHPQITSTSILQRVSIDLTKYQCNINAFLTLHYTSQAQSVSGQVISDIQDLTSLKQQTHGDLLYHIQELLFGYHLLTAKVARDQQDFKLSHHYANQTVRIAKEMQDTDLIATAMYLRGRTYLDWGRYGTTERNVFQIQIDEINKAIRDFENAKLMNIRRPLHTQMIGLIDIHLALAYITRSTYTGEKIPTSTITLLDNAEEFADKNPIHDPFQRVLLTSSQIGFTKGEHHNTKIKAAILMGMPGAALKETSYLASLRQGLIGKQFTRSQIWQDLIATDLLIALEQFEEATKQATNALISSRDIKSASSIKYIANIHGRLLQSDYGSNVQELGDMLHETEIDY